MDCDEISAVFSSETNPSLSQNSCKAHSKTLDCEITVEGAEKKSGAVENQVRPDGRIFIRVEQCGALPIYI